LAKATEKPVVKPEPEKPKKPEKKPEPDYHTNRYSDRTLGVGLTYHGNYFERRTQFYKYSTSVTTLDLDYFFSEIRIYGQLGLVSTPTIADAIPATYAHANFWMLGMESSINFGSSNISYGGNFRSFNDRNPGTDVYNPRELLNWTTSFYLDSDFHIFKAGPVNFYVSLASYLDMMSFQKTSTQVFDLGLLFNVESDLHASYTIPFILTHLNIMAGTSVAIIDDTSKYYAVDAFGGVTLEGSGRTGKFSGLRLGVGLSKYFAGAGFHANFYTYPSIPTAYQPLDTKNAAKTSVSYIKFGADYRFDLSRF
jgi:hypothetical protein